MALALAVPLGLLQGLRRNKVDDHLISAFMLICYAMPDFFSDNRDCPAQHRPAGVSFHRHEFRDEPGHRRSRPDPARRDTLPSARSPYFSRYMRSSVIDNLLEDYVRTAYARGHSTWGVLMRHVFRNSLLSVMTLIGLSLPYVFSGALIVETLFNFPGSGCCFTTLPRRGTSDAARSASRSNRRRGRRIVAGRCRLRVARPRGSVWTRARQRERRRTRAERPMRRWRRQRPTSLGFSADDFPRHWPADRGLAAGRIRQPRQSFATPRDGAVRQQGSRSPASSVIVILALFSFFGPDFYHTNQTATNLVSQNLRPSARFPSARIRKGRDELGRLMVGGQSSLEVGFGVAILATVFDWRGAPWRATSAASSIR